MKKFLQAILMGLTLIFASVGISACVGGGGGDSSSQTKASVGGGSVSHEHTIEAHEGKEATCTEDGYEKYDTCKNCDYTTYKKIAKLGHNYVDGVCTRCGEIFMTEGLLFTLNADDESYSVSGYEGTDTSVIIAGKYLGKPITAISRQAFSDNTLIEEVSINNSVTEIESYSFSGCSSLKSVKMPKALTSIASNAFYRCSELQSITIPDTVTSIGSYAFNNCKSLASVTIPDTVTSIGSSAFV